MACATLVVTPRSGTWADNVSTAYPETTFRILSAVPTEDRGFAVVEVTGPDASTVVDEMAAHPQIVEMEVMHQEAEKAVTYFEVSSPLLLIASRETGITIDLPASVSEGELLIEAIGSRDRLASFTDLIQAGGAGCRIERIGEVRQQSTLLTRRQREFIRKAVESGYYDTPRQCTQSTLAEELGVAKSTCSEILHRAEGAIVKNTVRELRDRPAE